MFPHGDMLFCYIYSQRVYCRK